jgi:hypothetical protein
MKKSQLKTAPQTVKSPAVIRKIQTANEKIPGYIS